MLSALILIPLLGAAIVGFLPEEKNSKQSRNLAILIAISILVVNCYLGWQFDTSVSGFQFSEFIPWLAGIGLDYSLGIDGLSFPLVCLNSLLTLIAILVTDKSIARPRLYYAMLLLLVREQLGLF